MRFGGIYFVLGAVLAAPGLASAEQPPTAITSAIADTTRPAADLARDSDRKPAAMLTFAGIAPGMQVFEIDPGRGYFTRLLSLTVGPAGSVIAYVPEESVGMAFKPLDTVTAIAAEPGRANVHPLHYPLMAVPAPEIAGTIDVVWTSQNYHDLHNVPGFDSVVFNRHILALLKPGGVYVVLDHAAVPGAGTETTHTLHRIDAGLVRREVEAAGFVFDGESNELANPADPRTAAVLDPTIKGHTDQFVLRFRKPG